MYIILSFLYYANIGVVRLYTYHRRIDITIHLHQKINVQSLINHPLKSLKVYFIINLLNLCLFFFLSRMWLPSIYWELPVLIRYYLQSPVTKQLLTTPITSQAVPRAELFLSLLVFKFLPLQYSVYLQTAASSPTDPHSSRFFLRLLLFPHPHPAIISDEAK